MNRKICVLTIIIILIILGLYKSGIVFFEYNGKKEVRIEAVIISNAVKKNYTKSYQAKINGKKFIIYIKTNEEFKIGDKILFDGEYNKPSVQRNYGGFDYNLYLKTKKIYGTFLIKKVLNVKRDNRSISIKIRIIISIIQKYIKDIFQKNLNKENSELLIGLLIGQKENIDSNTIEEFRNASLSHILAISGAHFSYIVLFLYFMNKKLKHKNLGNKISIVVILFFILLTGATPSVIRAGTMSTLIFLSSLLRRKSDFWTNLSISLLIQIIYNPYVIFDIGLILSYGGVIGIVLFYKIIQSKIKLKIISVTLSANLVIIPIIIYNFNIISFNFILSNLVASIILGPIIIIGYISTILKSKILYGVLNVLLLILRKTASFCANIPFSKMYVKTPSLVSILLFYVLLFILYNQIKFKIFKQMDFTKKEINNSNEKNIVDNIKIIKIKKLVLILMAFCLLSNINYSVIKSKITGKLYINFIDVGQGDCTLIRCGNKTLIVDSGGSESRSKYDVGKNILLPYLLDRKISKIDYIMVSHFDADHCQGFLFVLENLKVDNVIISKQYKNTELYKDFLNICKEKNMKIIYVKKYDVINIGNENNKISLQFLHPHEDLIVNNPLNNNAIVFKLKYGNFSMLFTGDIEKEAENSIINEYKKDNNILKATILKVGHHGSKTSSTQEFLEKVNPQIALIGVGNNNTFGHPSQQTLERLKKLKIRIFRTDKDGEISIIVNKKGIIKLKKYL